MLSANEHVGDGALVGHLLKGVLDVSSSLNLIKLDDSSFDILGFQELLGLIGEGAVRFAVNEDLAVIDVAQDGFLV